MSRLRLLSLTFEHRDVTTEWSVARRTGKLLYYHRNRQERPFYRHTARGRQARIDAGAREAGFAGSGFTMEAAARALHSVGATFGDRFPIRST